LDPILVTVVVLIAVVATAVVVVLLVRDDDGSTTAATDTSGAASTTTTVVSGTSAPVGTSEDIEDGRHFGYFQSVTPGDTTATAEFDLAQFFTGDAAKEAAAEDGTPDYELDYYIRNTNPRIRTLVVDPHADVTVIDPAHCCDPVASTVAAFAASVDPVNGCWVTIANGIVTRIEQQYLP